MKLQILLLALALPCTSLFSQTTYTWDGGGGDQLWNTATNWNPDGVPGALDNVVINNGFTVNVNVNAVMNNFDFTNPNGGAYLVGSGSLTVNGTFNMLGNVGTTGGVTINGTLNWDYTFQGSGTVNCNGTTNIGVTFAAATATMIVKLNGGGNWINDLYLEFFGHVQIPVGATLLHSGTNVALRDLGAGGGFFEILGTLRKSTAGIISVIHSSIQMTNSGTISMEAGSSLTIASSFTNSGLLKGNGIYSLNSTFTQSGSISPGNSPGILTLNKLPAGTANTFIEMQGTATPGVDYDQIAVNGAGEISGTLNISLLNSFTPTIGDEFIIMICTGGCSGSFSNIVHPGNNPNSWSVDVTTNPNEVRLKLAESLLPLELIDFQAFVQNEITSITWRTANEVNVSHFEIERSATGKDWQSIGEIQARNLLEESAYYFVDEHPLPGTSYYRLRQVDLDGTFEYSPIEVVTLNGDRAAVSEFYPNPISNTTVAIDLAAKEAAEWLIQIIDLNGKPILIETRPVVEGNNVLTLDVTGLAAGVYFVKMENGPERVCRKLVKG